MTLCTQSPGVVLNPHYTGLGIARNLGPLGVRVIGLSALRKFPGNHSRWLEFQSAPDSLNEPAALCDHLVRLGASLEHPPVLFPTRDHDITFIQTFRDVLEEYFILSIPEAEVLDRIMNKPRLFEVARQVGIDVARSVSFSDGTDVAAARELKFPVICKPVYAHQWRHPVIWEAVGRNKASRFNTFDEFCGFYSRLAKHDPRVVVQEWIPGGERNLLIYGSCCTTGGEPVAHFTARKRLQYPPLIGTGIVVESIRLHEIQQCSRDLLKALAFRGVSEIEFKRDERDDKLYLIELNPRHWDQHRLGTAVGVNISEAAYRDLTGQPVRTMRQRDESTIWIAEQGYARHLARVLVGRAPIADVGAAFGGSRCWGVTEFGDLRPFFAMLGLARELSDTGPASNDRETRTSTGHG